MSLIFDVTLIAILFTINTIIIFKQIKIRKLLKLWLISFISLISFLFGGYLWLKKGLILDYGYEEEKVSLICLCFYRCWSSYYAKFFSWVCSLVYILYEVE